MHMQKYSDKREIKNRTWILWLLHFGILSFLFAEIPDLCLLAVTGMVYTGLIWIVCHCFAYKLCWSSKGIQLYVGKFLRNQINYEQIELMVISNSMSSGRYSTKNGQTIKVNGKKRFVQFAHLTLFSRWEKLMDLDLAPGKQSTSLYDTKNQRNFITDDELYESICWLDYLEELLTYVQTAPIYILEDVYERFKLDFDRIFSGAKNPIYIVTAPHTCRQYLRKSVI